MVFAYLQVACLGPAAQRGPGWYMVCKPENELPEEREANAATRGRCIEGSAASGTGRPFMAGSSHAELTEDAERCRFGPQRREMILAPPVKVSEGLRHPVASKRRS